MTKQKRIVRDKKKYLSRNLGKQKEMHREIEEIEKTINIENPKMKIVLDCANNVPNLVSPSVFNQFGFDILTINKILDPTFPGRLSEPSSANLSVLKTTVVEEGATIGVAHDGDGDRFAIIDEKGRL